MEQFLNTYFLETGLGCTILGAIAAVMFGGIGSASGIRTAASQGAGVMAEKPELFGKLFILMGLPGTQGFYGFVYAFLAMVVTGLLGGEPNVSPMGGLSIALIGLGAGVVFWRSAVFQGETAAAAINLTAKRPEESGRAIILPALVETYAIVALLAAILLLFSIPIAATPAAAAAAAATSVPASL